MKYRLKSDFYLKNNKCKNIFYIYAADFYSHM